MFCFRVRVPPPKINYGNNGFAAEMQIPSFGVSPASYAMEPRQPDALSAIVGVAETAPPWFVLYQVDRHFILLC
jgi:hypothetical protein